MKIIDKIRAKKETWEISQIYGTLIFLALTVYFLIMYAVGLIHVVEFRFLNIVFMIGGIYIALRQYRRHHGGGMNYFRALALGTSTGFIGATAFAAFVFFFLKFEGSLMEDIRTSQTIGRFLNPYMAAFVIMIEGSLSAFGGAYLLMNYMGTNEPSIPVGGDIPMADDHGNYTSPASQSLD